MDDHCKGQLDSRRDRSEDVMMDIDEDWNHRPSPAESVLGPDTRDEADQRLSAMNQNDLGNLRTDLEHRLETLFAVRAKLAEVLVTTRLQEFQLDMMYRIRDRWESLTTTVTRRAAICFASMCFKATAPENLVFDMTTADCDNQFITHVIKKFLEDRFRARLDHYKAKIGSHIRTLNDDFWNRLDSYLTNLRNRYLDNMPSDPTTSSGGNVRQ